MAYKGNTAILYRILLQCHRTLFCRLECQVQAYPKADISWHVNGVKIEPGPRYMMGLEGQKSFLEIQNVKREDTGVYTCRAVSELGEAVTSTTLYVIGQLTSGL